MAYGDFPYGSIPYGDDSIGRSFFVALTFASKAELLSTANIGIFASVELETISSLNVEELLGVLSNVVAIFFTNTDLSNFIANQNSNMFVSSVFDNVFSSDSKEGGFITLFKPFVFTSPREESENN
jgi:hypothetical protein